MADQEYGGAVQEAPTFSRLLQAGVDVTNNILRLIADEGAPLDDVEQRLLVAVTAMKAIEGSPFDEVSVLSACVELVTTVRASFAANEPLVEDAPLPTDAPAIPNDPEVSPQAAAFATAMADRFEEATAYVSRIACERCDALLALFATTVDGA